MSQVPEGFDSKHQKTEARKISTEKYRKSCRESEKLQCFFTNFSYFEKSVTSPIVLENEPVWSKVGATLDAQKLQKYFHGPRKTQRG